MSEISSVLIFYSNGFFRIWSLVIRFTVVCFLVNMIST